MKPVRDTHAFPTKSFPKELKQLPTAETDSRKKEKNATAVINPANPSTAVSQADTQTVIPIVQAMTRAHVKAAAENFAATTT